MADKPYILIVDDDPVNLVLIADTLPSIYTTKTASSGKQSIEIAHDTKPDLVLLDIGMPQMDGYEVCRHFKSNEKLRDIPIIFLSAADSTAEKLKGFKLGAVDYIVKPFSPSEVLARVNTHLALRNAQKQLEDQNALLQEEIIRRKKAENELRKSEETYRSLFEKTNDAIFIIGLDNTIIEANQQAADLFDTTIDKIVSRPMSDFVLLDQSEAAQERLKQVMAGQTLAPYERTFQLRQGRKFRAEIKISLIDDDAGNPLYFHSIVRDVSERRQLQQALQESEQRYRGILENASEAVFSTDLSGCFNYINPIMVQRTPYTKDELIGRHFIELIEETWQENVSKFYTQQLMNGIRETVLTFPLKSFDQEQIWIEQTVNLIMDGTKATGFLGIARDITERKKVEAERERLIEELDAFAHTVAHDLKSPLSSVKISSEMLTTMMDKMPEEKRQRALQRIQFSVDKMANIVDALLLLGTIRKQDDILMHTLDMTQIIAEAMKRLNADIRNQGSDWIISDNLPSAIGYAPWVEEVWVNYISNAIKYGGKTASIEIGGKTLEDGSAYFWVQDNGEGIAPEDQEQLFTPFTRLNQINIDGHGLGLSIVQRIIEKLDGEVGVESQLGHGSRFYFTLPMTKTLHS